jgi:glutamine amidotransferase
MPVCRHLCYLGDPVALSSLIFDPPHSLAVQSYAPRDMRSGGSVNVDGFGAGWYPADGGEPALRYRRAGPIWHDTAFAGLAATTRSHAILAAVRNGTVGMPVTETAAGPFTDGRWLFSLNGKIEGWPQAAVWLAETLPTADLLTMDAPTDAALLWSAARYRLATGAEPGKVIADLVRQVLAAAPGSRLNLLLTDGSRAVATTVTHALSIRSGRNSVLLASEPLDPDPGWQSVPDHSLVLADRNDVEIQPL